MELDDLNSSFVEVSGSKMHYLYCGIGDPILFVHGVPTSSYLWRHVMPVMSDQGYCCAVDLIGMGKSDKPDIEYNISDHIHYLTGFIEALDLENITLVVHGWGSVAALHYAANHSDNVKALVMFESHVRPMLEWDLLSLPVQQFASMLQDMDDSYQKIVHENFIVKELLPRGVVRALTSDEMEQYEAPYLTPEDRKVLWQYVMDLPLGERGNLTLPIVQSYSTWLTKTRIPKLLLYAVPGFITTLDTVKWAKDHMPNLDLMCLDDVMHYAQESAPGLFSSKLKEWLVCKKKEMVI